MKELTTIVLLLLMSIASRSQNVGDEAIAKEIGISVGAMNSNTDIGGLPLDVRNLKPTVGLYASLLYKQALGLRLEASLGSVTASDKKAIKYGLKARNLDFTSSIKEISLLTEVHPFNLFLKHDQDNAPALSPYILAGVGYFAFNPRTQLNNTWIYLQPLHTEGEGFSETGRPNYKLTSLNFPVGGGLQYNISDQLTLRGEAVYRFSKTDYLDDVSTTYIDPNLFDKYLSPANAILAKKLYDRSYEIAENGVQAPGSMRGSSKKDAYYSINIKLGIRLATGSGHLYNNFSKKKSGCPAFRTL